MLVWMRNSAFAGAFKFLLLGLLLMACAGMIFMDRGGFFRNAHLTSNTVASGGGISIGVNDFDRTVRRAIAQQGIAAPEAYKLGLINNILTAEIQNRLFTQEAHSLGLEVGDESVKRQIAKLAEPLATEGRTKKQALEQILRQQNISEGEFVTAIRQEMANGLLRAAITPPASLSSPLMAQSLYRYDNEKRAADVIVLKNADVAGITAPTEDQLKKYYDANKQDFLIPETRTITMATLKGDMLKKNVKISDDQLKSEYDKNISSFTKPAMRTVEQVVVQDEAVAKKDAEDMKAGKAVKDSNVQDLEQDGLLPEIATPLYAAKVGEVIGPIKTALGWHVLKIKGDIPESTQAFDAVKEKLRDEMVNMGLTDQLYQAGNDIEDRAAGGDTLEQIVKDYGMTTEIVGPFRQNGNDASGKDLFKPYGADRDKLVQSAYDFNKGEIAPVVETADGQFHVMRIDNVVPDSYQSYDSVKADLQTRWMNEQRKLANAAKAKDALEALNSGKSIDDVSKQENAAIQALSNVNRQDKPVAPLTPIVAAQIFSTDKGKHFSSEVDNGYIVGTVTNITLPTGKPEEKNLKELEDLTGRSLSQDVLSQYVNGLSAGKNIKINQAVVQQMYGTQEQPE